MATLWQHAIGMAINMKVDGPALVEQAKLLKRANFSGYMIEAHEGMSTKYTPEQLTAHFKPFRDIGIFCGTWGYLKTYPIKEAQLANHLSRRSGSSFYVANPEIEYKYTGGDGNPQCLHCFERSLEFVTEFRRLRPTLPFGCSSYGRFDRADLHWAAWLNDGDARALPQAYANEQGPTWEPEFCFTGAVDVKQPHNLMFHPKTHAIIPGFPKSYIHITIAKPDPGDKYVLTIDNWIQYLINAKNAGHPLGFSAYEIENFTEPDLIKLGTAIKNHQLAAIR